MKPFRRVDGALLVQPSPASWRSCGAPTATGSSCARGPPGARPEAARGGHRGAARHRGSRLQIHHYVVTISPVRCLHLHPVATGRARSGAGGSAARPAEPAQAAGRSRIRSAEPRGRGPRRRPAAHHADALPGPAGDRVPGSPPAGMVAQPGQALGQGSTWARKPCRSATSSGSCPCQQFGPHEPSWVSLRAGATRQRYTGAVGVAPPHTNGTSQRTDSTRSASPARSATS